ncbi:MAG: tetratricopeptide repeat protein [Rhodanobacteraceae bacterium]
MNETASGLIARLKRRKLVQWALAYVAFAFALIQVLDVIAQRFGWPDQLEKLLILALAVGFLVALVLAWYHGERGAQKVSGTEIVILALLLAIGGGLLWQFARVPQPHKQTVATAFPSVSSRHPSAAQSPSTSVAAAIPAKSIAVLPFENLSEDKGNAYFADGIQDLILTKLAGIGDLKVISRTSTEKYASRPDNLKAVARQLGVATILEGSVQKVGDQVLIDVQLIDAASDSHLWAQAYSRKLDNIFGVEGEVAQKVADALKARLKPAETARVAEAPTRNAAAFDAFLQAEELAQRATTSSSEATYLAADADYLQAIALDPDFALAYARLAFNQLERDWLATPLTAAQLATTKAYADRALALAPNLPEAHLALGFYYYYGFRQYAAATIEFKRALALAPNNVDALAGLAYVARRSGQVAQALTYLKQAVAISPRDPTLVGTYGETFMMIRRYTQADTLLRRSLILSPDSAGAYDDLLQTQLFGFGDADAAGKAVKSLPGWRIAYGNVLAGDIMNLVNTRTYADVFARRFDAALHAWDPAPTETQEQRRTGQAARIVIKLLANRGKQARPDCEQLAPSLQSALAKDPKSLSLLQQSSWVDVCLGRNAEAIALAQRAVGALPISVDSYSGTYQLVGLAQIAAWTGVPDLAVKTIRQLLAMPAGGVMSIDRLKLDPVWDPLRKDPAFQALLARHADGSPATALPDARHD